MSTGGEGPFEVDGPTIRIRVFVQPRSARPGIAGRHGDALKVRVAAPPEDGRANEEVCRLLAGVLGVPRRAVTVISGQASRAKAMDIACADAATAEEVATRIKAALSA